MPERLGPPRAVPLFERLAIVGFGLIGSSIARACRHIRLAGRVVAIDRDEAVLARVRDLGIADEATSDAAAGVAGADLVILCVPVGVLRRRGG